MIFLLACAERAAEMAPAEQSASKEERDQERGRLRPLGYAEDEGGLGARGGGAPGGYGAAPAAPSASAGVADLLVEKKRGKGDAADGADALGGLDAALSEGAPTRAWFPESFFWQPMVEVPASGTVTVPVPVPDTLTTWRLLALGQSSTGAQAGAVATFASTLPAYVDLVAPTFLWAGDVLELPVQAVSQEPDPLSAALSVLAGGAPIGGGAVSLPAYGSVSETVTLRADRAGDLALVARLGELDAVEKIVPVRPVGRPVEQARGGTLASPRTVTLSGAGGAAGELVVTVFPGALGVARAELEAAPLRGDELADAAYTYAVTTLAAPLVAEGAVRPDTLRATKLRAWQRLARGTRVPDAEAAATALLAVRGAPADSLEGRLATRLAEQLTASQAPDGLWNVASGMTLDAALVGTARAVWALGPDEAASRLRATGAFERQRARLTSPYVAAWALAADVVDPSSAEALRTTVRDALRVGPDGAKTLRVEDARRADGTPVPEAEATALAILALPADDPAVPDLAAGLLGLYSPGLGFGDGAAGLVALRALDRVFAGDIPAEVRVRVDVDGAEVGAAVLDPKAPHAPVRILAPALAGLGDRAVTITATPAVPGLAFTAVARAYVPWVQSPPAGVDLQVERPTLAVGQRAELGLSLAGPAGQSFDVRVGLPAGVDPDRAALDALVANGVARSWHAEDGRVTLRGVVTAGGVWRAGLPVTPTLAGTLLADASDVRPAGGGVPAFTRVPERWIIR